MGAFQRTIPFICLFLCLLPCMSLSTAEMELSAFLQNSPFLFKTLLGSTFERDSGNNGSCAVCTALVGMTQQYAAINSVSIDDFIMNDFCKLFPGEIKPACQALVQEFGPTIIHALTQTTSADKACQIAKFCAYPQCILFTNRTAEPKMKFSADWSMYLQNHAYDENYSNPIDDLIKLLKQILDTKVPMQDLDGDLYSSSMAAGRGYHWRGRDCNDIDKKIHPGRKVDPYPGASLDYNCNGISGKDPKTRKDYKDELCANSGQLGVALLGDSAGIFAQIPNEFVTAADWNKTTFSNIWPTIMDQGGHPQFSAYTGYEDVGMYNWTVSSVYKSLYERNKCNFRDYQNLAVSGATSGATVDNVKLLSRNQTLDNPLLIILELAANDVCFSHTTPPDEFKQNILNILNYLDTVVPAGSHLVSIGLVNGSVIHEMTGGRIHPMGMKYDDFYDYLTCLGIDLCDGYLTSNLTHIAETTAKAMELNQVYLDVFANYTWKNFDFIHYDFPAREIIDNYTAMGGDPYNLISHVDGFHPSQIFNQMFGDYLWTSLSRDKPEWLGEINPNNDLITSLFGNQGGY